MLIHALGRHTGRHKLDATCARFFVQQAPFARMFVTSRSHIRSLASYHPNDPQKGIQTPTNRLEISPMTYSKDTRSWVSIEGSPESGSLDRGTVIRFISWNIHSAIPGQAVRAGLIMVHLREVFGDPPPPMVIMLQEVTNKSIAAILEDPWIREHFVVTDLKASYPWNFTIMMASRQINLNNCSRVPFAGMKYSGFLVADIPVPNGNGHSKIDRGHLRVCTAHGPVSKARARAFYRHASQIPTLLQSNSELDHNIIGSLIGGDLNIYHRSHSAFYDLQDAWEDDTLGVGKLPEHVCECPICRGNTFGYQPSSDKLGPSRPDRFLHTGSLDIVALTEPRDHSRKIGLLGKGLKTRITVWEKQHAGHHIHRGQLVPTTFKMVYESYSHGAVSKEIDVWASDHYGIAIGVRL